MLANFLELNCKRLYQSSGKVKESRGFVFTSSTKLEIRHLHVVVLLRRQGIVQKSVMHVQSCSFANLNLLLYCRSRCFVFTYNLLLWRSIVTCNRCSIVSSDKCLTYTYQTFCTMSFNRTLIKFFGWNIWKLRGHVCFNFRVDVARILRLAPY